MREITVDKIQWIKYIFKEVRFSIYAVLLINGIIVQYMLPPCFKCNVTEFTCPTCGMRHSISLLLQLKIHDAIISNKFIIIVMLIGAIMFLDCAIQLLQLLKKYAVVR